MGWFQDYADFVSRLPVLGGAKSLAHGIANNQDVAVRYQSALTGIPFLGGIIRGIDQARYAEDYYRNTGMVPKYPSLAPGYAGLVSGFGNAALGASSLVGRSGGYNVKEGTHDLLSFYNYAYA